MDLSQEQGFHHSKATAGELQRFLVNSIQDDNENHNQ
jgi:hypothetical protein